LVAQAGGPRLGNVLAFGVEVASNEHDEPVLARSVKSLSSLFKTGSRRVAAPDADRNVIVACRSFRDVLDGDFLDDEFHVGRLRLKQVPLVAAEELVEL